MMMRKLHLGNVSKAAAYGAKVALGTDAGAYAVCHGEAVAQEYALLKNAIGQNADAILVQAEKAIQEKF